MTTISMGRSTVHNSGLNAAPGLMNRVKTFISRRRAERQLHQLDDRLLADIGLNRAEITRSVWGN
jgi:uncharacterized protein YjiS (DUF1127 family)